MIGWRDKNYFFLMPDAAYAEVAAFCREAGEPLPPQADRLRQDLAKEGLTECEAGRTTLMVKLAGKSHRVLKLKISAVEELLGEHVPDDPLDAPDDLP